MEELRKVAMGYYNSLPQEKHVLAFNFFKALDTDDNNRVTLTEFKEFLAGEGLFKESKHSRVFKMFDQNGNGVLDYEEVIILFYYLTLGSGEQETIAKRCRKEGKWATASKALEALMLAFGSANVVSAGVTVAATTGCSIM